MLEGVKTIEEYECLPARDKVSGDERHCIWYERETLDRGSTILTESVIAIQQEGSNKLIERPEGKHGINSPSCLVYQYTADKTSRMGTHQYDQDCCQ